MVGEKKVALRASITTPRLKGEGKKVSAGHTGRLTGPRKLILDVVAGMGGEVRDEDGGATAIVHERLEAAGHIITAKSLANALKAMEDRGMIEREVRGKRTYAIRAPGSVQGQNRTAIPSGDGVGRLRGDRDDAGAARWDDGTDSTRMGGGGLATAVALTDIDRLAAALLDQVAGVLAREAEGTESAGAVEVKQRLAVAIDEAQRATKKLRDMEIKYDTTRDELAAVKQQERVWKQRLDQAEANIQAIVKAGGKPLDDRKLKALEKFIATAPNAKR